VNHAVDTVQGRCELLKVSQVAVDDLQAVVLRQPGVAEQHDVVDDDAVACLKQFGNENAADIAGSTRDEDLLGIQDDLLVEELW